MSGPPRRPGAPSPALSIPRPPPLDPNQNVRGVGENNVRGMGESKRPPGPPPGAPPLMALKPPPFEPPPRNLAQVLNRPPLENFKPIEIPGPQVKGASFNTNSSSDVKLPTSENQPGRGMVAPRSLIGELQEEKESKNIAISSRGAAAPKFNSSLKPTLSRKAGAISMFESPKDQPPQEPAEKKIKDSDGTTKSLPRGAPRPGPPTNDLMARIPRPLPPPPQPEGIPLNQPLPPETQPEKEISIQPAPLKPAPNRNRAPPREDPVPVVPTPTPPEEPPTKKEKKEKLGEIISSEIIKETDEFDEISEDEGPSPVSSKKGMELIDTKKAHQISQFEPVVEKAESAENLKTAIVPFLTENLKNSTIKPTSAIDPEIDFESKLAKRLSAGRFSIKCIRGSNIRRQHDTSGRSDPFLRLRLGQAERHPWRSSEYKRKQTTEPSFDGDVISFDVLHPVEFVIGEDLVLCIEVWNKSTLRDEIIGEVSLSVVRFFEQPFVAYQEVLPLYFPGETETTMSLTLEFLFQEARRGMVSMTLFEAKGLRVADSLSVAKQRPYVQFSLGDKYKKRSSSVRDGGTTPYFSEEEVCMFVDGENWVHDLQIVLYDDVVGTEKQIGYTHFCLLPSMNIRPDDAQEEWFDLFYSGGTDKFEKKELPCGQLRMRIKFLPAGKLTVFLDKAKNLSFPDTYMLSRASMDPYVKLSLDGLAVQIIRESPADKDGGSDPSWQHDMSFDIVDQYAIDFQVWNQSSTGTDVLLGYTKISLLTVFRNGVRSAWFSLKQKKQNGGVREIGDVHLELSFSGPVGISYPQFRPDMDSFDDSKRKILDKTRRFAYEDRDSRPLEEEPAAAVATSAIVVPEKDDKKIANKTKSDNSAVPAVSPDLTAPPPEFTEAEIIAAFKFIDLDRNNFVGAKEIRHILVCMGEMVTDEEIDTMIQLVDTDGDGQVSFDEFRTLVLHPDPSSVDMYREVERMKNEEINKKQQAVVGKVQGLDFSAHHRQKEMSGREAKRKLLVGFVTDNEVTFDYIKLSHQSYLALPLEMRLRGKLKFDEFCQVLAVEKISEYRILHDLFDTEELQEIDFKEFLLSLMNFVDIDKEIRMRFSFSMFDEMQTGFITEQEIEEILRGNHMISLASVKRKAETVMKQASKNSSGSITSNELVVISKKFPNILLPTIGVTK